MANCRICGNSINAFMSFGRMPIANGFLSPEQVPAEYFFELAPAFCDGCKMFQIVEQPDPQKMFHDHYAFFSSTSRHMQAHFKRFSEQVTGRALDGVKDPFVVELGSNDGIMLKNFQERGVRHLGVEPSGNVADVARQKGIATISEFFDSALADRIAAEHGKADAILAANVMCHIPDLGSVAAGIRKLIADKGVLMFEDPYLGDMVAKTSYDQIYDEHVFIFSATSVANAFARYGLELIDAIPQSTHGGSMRYVLSPSGSRPVSASVGQILEKEAQQGLARPDTYEGFRRNCERSRDSLVRLLKDLKREGKRVVGYGATSKSTTVTNYCGIGPELVEFISDTTPIKQGKLSPGQHIPVKPYDEFKRKYPDYALLFAWNHMTEIREKESEFVASGGRWIVFVPEVDVLP